MVICKINTLFTNVQMYLIQSCWHFKYTSTGSQFWCNEEVSISLSLAHTLGSLVASSVLIVPIIHKRRCSVPRLAFTCVSWSKKTSTWLCNSLHSQHKSCWRHGLKLQMPIFFNPPSTCLDRIWDSLVHLDLQSFACFCILFLAWSSIAVHLPEHDEKSCLFGDDVFHFRDSAGMVFRGLISHLSCGRMCVAFIWSLRILDMDCSPDGSPCEMSLIWFVKKMAVRSVNPARMVCSRTILLYYAGFFS